MYQNNEILNVKQDTEALIKFTIIKEDLTPILDLGACMYLKLIKRINAAATVTNEEITHKWKENFDSIGRF